MTTAEPTTEKGDDLVARMNRTIDAMGERLEGLEAELEEARELLLTWYMSWNEGLEQGQDYPGDETNTFLEGSK